MTDNINNDVSKGFCKTVDAIALALLLNTALSQTSPRIRQTVSDLSVSLGITEGGAVHYGLISITSIILYCVVFFLPALFIFKYAPKNKKTISLSPALPKGFIGAAIAVPGCVALSSNATALGIGLMKKIGIGIRLYTPEVPESALETVMLIVSSAIVPAIAEEILFRKAILERLTPYGNSFAVIVTAGAFALMHANPSQLLYAFTAGLLLGYITVMSGSVIPAVIIHFLNNALSVGYLILQRYAPITVYTTVTAAADTALMLAAVVLLCLYARKRKQVTGVSQQKNEALGFSPFATLFRVFTVGYVAYTVFLMTRWIYII